MTNPELQECIHKMRREADLLECKMRGIELGVFMFEKQNAYLKSRYDAIQEERQACIDAIKIMKDKYCSDPMFDVAMAFDAAVAIIQKRSLEII